MGRGLGPHQLAFLAAANRVAKRSGLDWMKAHHILDEAWRSGLADRVVERATVKQKAAAEASAASRADLERRAESGDKDAQRLIELGDMIRASHRRRRRDHIGRPARRPHDRIEAALNPSRILATLVRRGLLQARGLGQWRYYALTAQGKTSTVDQ